MNAESSRSSGAVVDLEVQGGERLWHASHPGRQQPKSAGYSAGGGTRGAGIPLEVVSSGL